MRVSSIEYDIDRPKIPTISSKLSIDCLIDLIIRDDHLSIVDQQSQYADVSSTTKYELPVLSFREINCTTPKIRNSFPVCLRSVKQRNILTQISGAFNHGLHAIMGPSGCGKSTLLDILADRKDSSNVSGHIRVDGIQRDAKFRHTVGYVVQDDICSGTLTVRENITFSAHLRLSNKIDSCMKNERVSQIIRELDLEACADTRVGSEFLRGVSGGERKRTCIGMELVLLPKILFLDEPTTGLDASTAANVIRCLKELSEKNRTIIFSIHQPRYSIFKLFDSVMYLCQGKCVYQGPIQSVIPYFTKYGYQCEPYDNPADFVLDVLIDVQQKPETLAVWSEVYQTHYRYHNNSYEQNYERYPKKTDESNWHTRSVKLEHSIRIELFHLSKRTILNAIRNPALALSQTMVSIIMGFLVGLLFYNLDKNDSSGVQNRLGAIFFIIISQVFSTVTAVESMIKERALFIHEYSSGYYRISTFFTSKLLCDLIPMRVIPSTLFSIISYFMMGFNRSADRFFIYLITIFMSSIFGSGFCFFIAASVSSFAIAFILITLILVTMMMFSGFLIDLDSIVQWLSWIQWISAFRYASNSLTINEFSDLTLSSTNVTDIYAISGLSILNRRGITYQNQWDLWKNLVALTTMALTFFILAYIQLIRIKKTQ